MITVNGLQDESGTFYPEYVPENTIGNNFDGVNFIYFENKVEKEEYYKQLENVIND